MRAAAFAGLLALLTLPPALAQTVVNPVTGGYEDNYVVAGRILDADGKPASGARVVVTIDQAGVRAEEVRGTANCKGDFIVPFQGFVAVSAQGRARVTVVPPGDQGNATSAHPLDPFYRRTDARVRLPYAWDLVCADAREPPFSHVVSVVVRAVNRTGPYEHDGGTFHARAYKGPVALRWVDPDGRLHCPPTGDGRCDTSYTDERGDVRYSWIFPQPVAAGGAVQLFAEGRMFNATVDPDWRVAVHHVELTGQGPPPPSATPLPGLAGLLAAAALAALALRRASG